MGKRHTPSDIRKPGYGPGEYLYPYCAQNKLFSIDKCEAIDHGTEMNGPRKRTVQGAIGPSSTSKIPPAGAEKRVRVTQGGLPLKNGMAFTNEKSVLSARRPSGNSNTQRKKIIKSQYRRGRFLGAYLNDLDHLNSVFPPQVGMKESSSYSQFSQHPCVPLETQILEINAGIFSSVNGTHRVEDTLWFLDDSSLTPAPFGGFLPSLENYTLEIHSWKPKPDGATFNSIVHFARMKDELLARRRKA